MSPTSLERLEIFNSSGDVHFEDELDIVNKNKNSNDIDLSQISVKHLFQSEIVEEETFNYNQSSYPEVIPNYNETSLSTKESNIMKGSKLFLGLLFNCLTPELLRKFILAGLNMADEMVKKTPNKVDDVIVNALTNRIRELLGDDNTNNYNVPDYGYEASMLLNQRIDNAEKVCNDMINTNLGKQNNLFSNMSNDFNKIKHNPFL